MPQCTNCEKTYWISYNDKPYCAECLRKNEEYLVSRLISLKEKIEDCNENLIHYTASYTNTFYDFRKAGFASKYCRRCVSLLNGADCPVCDIDN